MGSPLGPVTFEACQPFAPLKTKNSTVCPSERLLKPLSFTMAVWCTNTRN